MLRSAIPALLSAVIAAHASAQGYVDGSLLSIPTRINGVLESTPVDFDADGTLDLVYSSSGNIVVAPVDLASTSVTPSILIDYNTLSGGALGTGSLDVVEDINGDGILDVIASFNSLTRLTTRIYLFLGTGGGQVAPPLLIHSTSGSVEIRSGDFEGDGTVDVGIGRFPPGQSGELQILTQGSNLRFTLTFRRDLNSLSVVPTVGDFNGDGVDDIAVVTGFGPFDCEIHYGGPGIATPQVARLTTDVRGFAAAGDVNGDGLDDLLAVPTLPASASPLFLADPTLVVIPGSTIPGTNPTGLFDIDIDGNLDVLTDDFNGAARIYRGNGTGAFSGTPLGVALNGASFPFPADVDLDGDLDLLAGAPRNGGLARFENRAFYGNACAGTSGEPTLEIGTASPGNGAFSITIRNALPGAICDVLLSDTATPGPCGPQVDLRSVFATRAGFFSLIADPSGSATLAAPIPPGAPIGPYFLQGIVTDPSGAFVRAPNRFAATRARAIEIF